MGVKILESKSLNGFRRAIFSDCMTYRYRLEVIWDTNIKPANFIMLNPSIADHLRNDPTVERQVRRMKRWDFECLRGCYYGGLIVTNLFALVSTDPKALKSHSNPVGGLDNDGHIVKAASESSIVVCAWGLHGKIHDRGDEVKNMLDHADILCHILKFSKDGTPTHPLYLKGDLEPCIWL